MASKQQEREFVLYPVDLLQSIGPVTAKPMFGGFGLFIEGLMLGLVADSTLYFKADELSKVEFETHGLEPFTFFKASKPIQMSYWQAPQECLDNADAMLEWGTKGSRQRLEQAP
ncbi:MAG: DNA transformation protein [Pseudohongiellaceae bacterium]|jgi:DNA transformation protein